MPLSNFFVSFLFFPPSFRFASFVPFYFSYYLYFGEREEHTHRNGPIFKFFKPTVILSLLICDLSLLLSSSFINSIQCYDVCLTSSYSFLSFLLLLTSMLFLYHTPWSSIIMKLRSPSIPSQYTWPFAPNEREKKVSLDFNAISLSPLLDLYCTRSHSLCKFHELPCVMHAETCMNPSSVT